MRPMLERIDFTVRHLAGVAGDLGDFERTSMEGLEQSVEDALLQTTVPCASYGMDLHRLSQSKFECLMLLIHNIVITIIPYTYTS